MAYLALGASMWFPGRACAEPVAEAGKASAQEQATAGGLATMPQFFLKGVRFEGNAAIPTEELERLSAPYCNRQVTFEELQRLREELSRYYVQKGYISSGVVIPDQDVPDGVVTFRVVEGVLSRIDVEGNRYYPGSYYKDRIARSTAGALNVSRLQDVLQQFQQDQRIRRINATLSPGTMQGEGLLKVVVEEEPPFHMDLRFSNSQSPSVGAYLGELGFAHHSLLGRGDVLSGGVGISEGTHSFNIGYTVPVSGSGTTVGVYLRRNDALVIEDLFSRLSIEDRSDTYGISVRQPVYRSIQREVTLSLTGESRKSQSYLLGLPFSFSEGQEEGRSRVTVIRFGQEFVQRSALSVVALRSLLSLGVGALGATKHESRPDGRFVAWLGQFQWIRLLNDAGLQLRVRADVQLANDSLLPIEKFSVGGMNSVRGYRTNLLVRDNGLSASAELRVPVISGPDRQPVLDLISFCDAGRSWNARGDTPFPKTVAGAGVGVKWTMGSRASLEIYAARPLVKVRNLDRDLQDEGVHFLFAWQLF